jgi:hypothetical protein
MMTNCYANCNDYRHPAPYDKAWLRNVVRVPGDALTLQRVYIDPTIDPASAVGIVECKHHNAKWTGAVAKTTGTAHDEQMKKRR